MTIRKLNLKRLAAEYGRIYAAANIPGVIRAHRSDLMAPTIPI